MAAINYLGGEYESPAAKAADAAAAAQAKQTQQDGLQKYANIAIGDLNSGNYAGALQAGLDSGKLYDTNYSSVTQDPLLQALETSQGLQELDPSKKWDANSISQYYAAFGANNVTQGKQAGTANAGESWGQNGYGLWGDPSKIAGDAQTNINTGGDNSAPDLMRFAGAKPTKSFLGKYGMDIAALAATALSFGVAAPALAGALAADGIASGLAAGAIAGGIMGGVNTLAVDALTGKPITAGGVLGGALGGAAGGGLLPLAGGAINDATGLGSTISTGLAGAGIGATQSALTGGNVGLGALTGGIGGAVQGSGVAGNIKGALTGSGVPSGLAGAVTNGGINYAVGGITGAAAGALMGTPGQPGARTVAPSMGQQVGPQGGGSMGNLNPNPNSPTGMSVAGSQPGSGSNFLGTGMLGAGLGVGGMLSQGAQGNNGNMAATSANSGMSTDASLAQVIGGTLPGVIQGAAGVYGSQNAAEKQTQADQNAINTQTSTLGNINNIWATQQQTGQGANTALQSSLGLNGQTADPSNFLNMPGYQFAVQQGTQAIQRQAASMGSAYTPNTSEAIGQYVTGTAAQDYNTYISQLMGAAGLGTTANQGLQTGAQTVGNNISTLQQNQGQAQASGVSGASNAIGGLFGVNGAGTSLIGAAGRALTGGGSSGGGGGGSGMSGNPAGPGQIQNYGGQNPNGTSGNGTASDPYGANTAQYNANNPYTYDPNSMGIDPNTLGNIPAFDPNSITMPDINIDQSAWSDLGDGATDFLGDGW